MVDLGTRHALAGKAAVVVLDGKGRRHLPWDEADKMQRTSSPPEEAVGKSEKNASGGRTSGRLLLIPISSWTRQRVQSFSALQGKADGDAHVRVRMCVAAELVNSTASSSAEKKRGIHTSNHRQKLGHTTQIKSARQPYLESCPYKATTLFLLCRRK